MLFVVLYLAIEQTRENLVKLQSQTLFLVKTRRVEWEPVNEITLGLKI